VRCIPGSQAEYIASMMDSVPPPFSQMTHSTTRIFIRIVLQHQCTYLLLPRALHRAYRWTMRHRTRQQDDWERYRVELVKLRKSCKGHCSLLDYLTNNRYQRGLLGSSPSRNWILIACLPPRTRDPRNRVDFDSPSKYEHRA